MKICYRLALGVLLITATALAVLAADAPPVASQPATAPSDPNTDSPADIATLKLLEENIKEISADRQGLEKVLAFLQENTNVNMDIHWKTLADVGVDRNTPITLNLKAVAYRRVLDTVLANASDQKGDITFVVEDGVVIISTRAELQSVGHRVTRIYNVRDLVPAPIAPKSPPATQPAPISQTLAAELQKILQETAPDGEFHATAGSLSQFNGLFIIETTPHIHRHIADLLAKIRAASAPQQSKTEN